MSSKKAFNAPDIFANFKSHLRFLGVLKPQISLSNYTFLFTLVQRVCTFTLFSLNAVASFWFFFYEAKELNEFVESFLFASTFLVTLIWYCFFLASNIEVLIDEFSGKIQTQSQTRAAFIYPVACKSIEKWANFLHDALLKICVPSFVFPLILLSFYKYFTTHSENSFLLVYSMS